MSMSMSNVYNVFRYWLRYFVLFIPFISNQWKFFFVCLFVCYLFPFTNFILFIFFLLSWYYYLIFLCCCCIYLQFFSYCFYLSLCLSFQILFFIHLFVNWSGSNIVWPLKYWELFSVNFYCVCVFFVIINFIIISKTKFDGSG